MRRRLPLVVFAVIWGIVVAVAAAGVWSAISRAGSHVTNQSAPTLPVSITPSPTPVATPEPTPEATVRATPLPTPRTTARATPRATSRATPGDSRTDDPEPAAHQASWSGQAGRVTATCRGQRIKLDAAVPADGFTVEVGNRGPETLEIEFHQTGRENEIQVKGVCRTDGPRFTVEED